MQDMLLLAAVGAIFVFGWFLMGKLDRFLEENRHAQEIQISSEGDSLWIGFCDPTVADSMTDGLEQYSKLYPDVSVCIFCGSEKELMKNALWSDGTASFFTCRFIKCLENKFTVSAQTK